MKNAVSVILASLLIPSFVIAASTKHEGKTRIPASIFDAQGTFNHSPEFKKACESLGLKGKVTLKFNQGKVLIPFEKPMMLSFDSNLKKFLSRQLPELADIGDYEGIIHSVEFDLVTGKLFYFSSSMIRGKEQFPSRCETTFMFDNVSDMLIALRTSEAAVK